MSLIFATQLTAIATAVLAVFAIVTAVFAILAFRKQSREVRAIERQVKDQEALTRQQADLLEIQSGQLEVQRQQLNDQRTEQRRAQASRILISAEPRPDPETGAGKPIRTNFALVTNTSQQPIYDLKFLFREADGEWTALDDPPEPALVLMPGKQYQYPFEADGRHWSQATMVTAWFTSQQQPGRFRLGSLPPQRTRNRFPDQVVVPWSGVWDRA
jgi:hypothetical protein